MSLTCRAEYDLNGVGERTVADAGERCDLELVKVVGAELGDNLLGLPSVDDDRAASGSARRHAAPVDTIALQFIDRHTHTLPVFTAVLVPRLTTNMQQDVFNL